MIQILMFFVFRIWEPVFKALVKFSNWAFGLGDYLSFVQRGNCEQPEEKAAWFSPTGWLARGPPVNSARVAPV